MPKPTLYTLVVAAGVGKRFGSDLPKQYSQIHGKTVLEHSVAALQQVTNFQQEKAYFENIYVVISAQDDIAKTLKLPHVQFVLGGQERMHSVFNGVQVIWETTPLENRATAWVLIHDAARPCVKPTDIKKLIEQVTQSETGKSAGGILAVPVRDTIKQSSQKMGQTVSQSTIDRNRLWLAQTPQLFPLEPLYRYLNQASMQPIPFTDEASLFEHFGQTPLLVPGSHSNIKLTFAEDLLFAQVFLG